MSHDRVHAEDGAGDLYYIQVRYPHGDRWVTVGHEMSKRDAARQAALAFPEVVDASGLHASQVRVIGAGQLRGSDALDRAHRDLLSSGQELPRAAADPLDAG